ncbi:MAG: XRE family transcriptional regulator [Myxococcales bacterium]|nr:XRE family transcriptional regulator [Polyangiaceae bacterium]MDW8251986.1 XRE family transcriptional regulator [Myxococcales bacterium]
MSKGKTSQPIEVEHDPAGDDIGAAKLSRRVADNLRRLRKDRALSLEQLSAASGVSRAALSQIEGSKTNPTLMVLWKIAVGLGVPFQALLGTEEAGKAKVLRAGDTMPLRSPDGRIESRLLTPSGATPGLEVYELRFQPRGLLKSESHGAGTTETVTLLTGVLRVQVGEEVYDLAPGDTIFFQADSPHSYENRSTREARCLDVICYGRSSS